MKSNLLHKIQSLCVAAATFALGSLGRAADNPSSFPPLPGDDLPTLEILATDPTALAGTSSAAFTLIRTGPLDKDLTVKFSLSGTASNGKDFNSGGAALGTSTVIPANFAAQDIVITALVNPESRGNKTLIISLDVNGAYQRGEHRKATVSLVDDLYNDLPPKVSLAVTGGKPGTKGETVYELPATVTLVATASDSDDKVAKVSFYADDQSIGSVTAADANGTFSFDWVNPRPGTYSLFARAVDQLGKSTLSQPVSVVVKGTVPKVALATIKAPTPGGNLELSAKVTAGSGAIAKVEFFGDSKSLGVAKPSAADPTTYQLVWNKLEAGSHTVSVTVTDTLGFSAKASTAFKVTAPPNKPPVIKIDAPKTGTTYPAKPTITLTADASDPDNAVVRVAFYANEEVVGIVRKADAGTTTKYTVVWDKPASGKYTIKAHATDALGVQTWSAPISIVVSK